jgi:hypothetical protein
VLLLLCCCFSTKPPSKLTHPPLITTQHKTTNRDAPEEKLERLRQLYMNVEDKIEGVE